MSRRNGRHGQFWREYDLRRDKMRPGDPICPWCGNPDKKARSYPNGSHEARRLIKKGRARIVNRYRSNWPKRIYRTSTLCAHGCHSA